MSRSDTSGLLLSSQLWLQHLFTYLSLEDLFRFRAVSRDALSQVDDFFRRLTRLDLSSLPSSIASHRFTWSHFALITHRNVSLRHLNLASASWIEDGPFQALLRRQARLQTLDLSRSYSITNETLCQLAISCPKLTRLYLRHCSWLTEATFLQMIINLEHLVEIELTSCWNLTDTSIETLFNSHGTTLERVVLSSLYSLTDQSTKSIQDQATCLHFLDISACWRITDAGIRNLCQIDSLQEICITGCTEISLLGHRLLLESGIETVATSPSSK